MTGHRPFKHLRQTIPSERSVTNSAETQAMLLGLRQVGIKSQAEPAARTKAEQPLVVIDETDGSSNTDPIKE